MAYKGKHVPAKRGRSSNARPTTQARPAAYGATQRVNTNTQNYANAKPKAQSKTKKKSGGKAALIIVIILLILVILFCAGAILVNAYLNKIQRVNNNDIEIIPPSEATDEVDEPDNTEDPEENQEKAPEIAEEEVEWWQGDKINDKELVNILLVGQDSRGNTRERSDAMILCSINTKTYEVSMVSFLRDLYVQMPEGYMDNRMNAAYAFGGFPYLYDVLDKNFGVSVDGGMEVNFDGFKNVIDALGGVDIELTSAEANHLNNLHGWALSTGPNHLDGDQALQYSRIRYLDSDFGRTQRQRNVLNSIFASVKNADAKTLLALVDELIPMVTTDMTNKQIIELAMALVPHMSSLEINSYHIPTDDGYYGASIRGMSVLVPDLKVNREALEEYLPLD